MSKQVVARMVAHSSRSALSSRRRGTLLMSAASFALTMSWPMPAFAQAETTLPSGGTVIGGTASIGTPTNAQLQIDQSSDRAIITWDSFDIGSAAGVTFSQPGASSIALNRVVGGSAPSQIAGQLNANGIVAVINSNGVVFAGTANVNVGGLIASAADVADEAFMAGGALSFTGSPSSISEIVVSAGASISIADEGLGLFFAPVVRNAGVISARLGRVTLASGTSATLDLDGTGFLEIGLGNESALVSNSGTINAGGGRIHMTAKAASAVIDQVVNTGILSVASATSDPDGTIILSAQTGNAVLGGSLDVGSVGSASVVAANEVKVESAVAATGNLSVSARHIRGAGDINVTDGALALTLDVAGADTSGEGDFVGDALSVIGTVSGGVRLDLGAGIYGLSNTLNLDDSITLAGQGQDVTILDASGHNNYGIRVKASDVTLSGFTLNGKPDATGSAGYGIKVESGGDSAARNSGFTIRDVTINNSRKTGLDLNAAVDALIDGVTVTGVTAGNGITIIDSANVTVRNSRTSGNAWGGVALYQANNLNSGGSDQQLTGITIEANNDFAEATGLYLQASSTLYDVGTLNIQGYDFTVRNDAHRNDGSEFTFFQKTQQNAFDYGVNLAAPEASVVQGWTGTGGDANFYVGFGALTGGGSAALSLHTAVDKSSDGAIVHVGSGTYVLSNTLNVGDSITLAGQGQGVTILDASGHNSYGIRVKASM